MRKNLQLAGIIAIVGLLAGLVVSGENFILLILSQVLIFSIAALGLNILTGMGGQVSIGNAAFMSIGAYTSVMLVTRLGVPMPLAALGGAALASLFGLLIGFPALRMKGFYLAVATMAFGVVIEQLINVIPALGAHDGIRNIPKLFRSDFLTFLFNLAWYIGLVIVAKIVNESPVGLRWRMVRDGETAARCFGVDAKKAKLSAFMMSAAYGGIAGALYANTVGYIRSADFGLVRSLDLLAMIMIGGLGSYQGGLAGALIIVGLRFFFSRGFGPWLTVIIGALLIVFTLFFPRGIAWGLTVAWHKTLQRPYVALRRALAKKRQVNGIFIETEKSKVFYTESGEGRPLVCIHGNLGSARWWEHAPELDGYRIIAPDLPGFGRSSPLPDADIAGYAKVMLDFIAALKLEKPLLLGHSLGGAVVMSMLDQQPKAFAAAILVDSCPPSGLATPEEHYPVIELYKSSYSLLHKAMSSIAPALKQRKVLDGLVDEALLMSLHYYAGNARTLQVFRYPAEGEKPAYKGPVLVVRGRKDTLISAAMAKDTAAVFKEAELVEFESCGHSPMVEDPADFSRALTAFLLKHFPA
ncbi:MAG: alpha/beta fold hydrolase [Spirochaetes bacterium]|nr:alpha/beta fold hydrolase [Spirochaetota bacterium]